MVSSKGLHGGRRSTRSIWPILLALAFVSTVASATSIGVQGPVPSKSSSLLVLREPNTVLAEGHLNIARSLGTPPATLGIETIPSLSTWPFRAMVYFLTYYVDPAAPCPEDAEGEFQAMLGPERVFPFAGPGNESYLGDESLIASAIYVATGPECHAVPVGTTMTVSATQAGSPGFTMQKSATFTTWTEGGKTYLPRSGQIFILSQPWMGEVDLHLDVTGPVHDGLPALPNVGVQVPTVSRGPLVTSLDRHATEDRRPGLDQSSGVILDWEHAAEGMETSVNENDPPGVYHINPIITGAEWYTSGQANLTSAPSTILTDVQRFPSSEISYTFTFDRYVGNFGEVQQGGTTMTSTLSKPSGPDPVRDPFAFYLNGTRFELYEGLRDGIPTYR